LNAFTTPQFLAWLDEKMAAYEGKVIPPTPVLEGRLNDQVREQLRESITKRVLEKAKIDDQVDEAMAARSEKLADAAEDLSDRVAGELEDNPQRHWAEVVDDFAVSVAE
jgi:hypothetical protein